MDVICQAKSGMGKTAIFVLSTLQQIEPVSGQVAALLLCHTRELAYQICHEFERFSTYLPDIKVAVFYGGVNIKLHKELLKNECPHIVVGTPGRIHALARDKDLSLRNCSENKELQEKIYHLEQQLVAVKAEKSYPSLERVSAEYVDELRKKIQFQDEHA